MKLRKILLDEHYRLYWKQGPILPDPYPPDHPRAPCYRCNQLCQGVVNWLERVFRFLLVPSRRHRTRCLLLIAALAFMITVINRGQHPMTLNHSIHSPTSHSSWHGFFSALFGGSRTERKPIRRQLVQDWVFAPNCDALLRGDEEEIHFTKRMLYREVRDKVTDSEYYENTKSCAEFRASEGYPPVPLSPEEANFPTAYVIQSYKNAEQLHRLLKSIYAPQNPYCICSNHKATPEFDKSVRSISNCFNNVYHVSTLKFNRTRGHRLSEMDDIRCAHKCMKVLLNADWKYLIKIHGQDFPLVTTQYIVAKLRNLERLKIPFISDYSHMHRKQSVKVVTSEKSDNKSETSIELTLWRGSPYFIASKNIIQQVMDDILAYKLLPIIEHHEHPEAYYWVTLFLYAMRDANHAAIVAANMHRIELLTQKNLHTKQYCAGVTQLLDPCVLGVEDLSKLFHIHQHQFFAHGFDLDHDHVAYNCLEQRVADAVAEYGGNLTLTFNDIKLHARHPEVVLAFKDKPSEKAQPANTDSELIQERLRGKAPENVKNISTFYENKAAFNRNTTNKKNTQQDDSKKLISETEKENEDAARRRRAKQNLENKSELNVYPDAVETDREEQAKSENGTRTAEDKKLSKHTKGDAEYYNGQMASSVQTEQKDGKHLERRIPDSDVRSEKGVRPSKETAKDLSGTNRMNTVLFPVTNENDISLKDLTDLLKSVHGNKHKREPEKLELDMLELSQEDIKGKVSTQEEEETKKEIYRKTDIQPVYVDRPEARSADTALGIESKHEAKRGVLNSDADSKDRQQEKYEAARASNEMNIYLNKDIKELQR